MTNTEAIAALVKRLETLTHPLAEGMSDSVRLTAFVQVGLEIISALKPIADGKSVAVPVEPTEAMWGGDLVRIIVRWMGVERPTPESLLHEIKLCGAFVPDWLKMEKEMQAENHVVSKGTRAVIIYRAMLEAAQEKPNGYHQNTSQRHLRSV